MNLSNWEAYAASQQEVINAGLKDVSDKQGKVNTLIADNKALSDTLNAQKTALDSQQSSINTQLTNLDIQKKAQDETELSQEERQQYIDLQNRALDQKIQILQALRASKPATS